MKSAAIATALLVSAAVAQPHGPHRRHHHDKRELVVEWETVEETVTVYVDESTTETVYPSTTAEVVATSSGSPGQFFQAASASASSSSSSAAAPSTTLVAQPSTEQTYAPAPTSTSTSTTPVVVVPTTTTTPAAAPAETTTHAAAAATTTAAASSGGSSSSGTEHSGDMTYYQIGLGSCGYDDSGLDLSKPVVAISSTFWESVSSLTSYGIDQPAHPFCDQEITIKYNGKTTTGIVRDRCPGCPDKGIDVSELIFDDLVGGTGAGRVEVEWSFNSGKW